MEICFIIDVIKKFNIGNLGDKIGYRKNGIQELLICLESHSIAPESSLINLEIQGRLLRDTIGIPYFWKVEDVEEEQLIVLQNWKTCAIYFMFNSPQPILEDGLERDGLREVLNEGVGEVGGWRSMFGMKRPLENKELSCCSILGKRVNFMSNPELHTLTQPLIEDGIQTFSYLKGLHLPNLKVVEECEFTSICDKMVYLHFACRSDPSIQSTSSSSFLSSIGHHLPHLRYLTIENIQFLGCSHLPSSMSCLSLLSHLSLVGVVKEEEEDEENLIPIWISSLSLFKHLNLSSNHLQGVN